ncbi:MAG: hypothetical protein JKY27_11835 [Magnetovibrio sp.]|nr:hypothetical protein [Magnetovibrio sp.]
MLLEVRKLVFSDDLLQQALLNHFKIENIAVPNTQIQKVRFSANTGKASSIVVEFVTADPKKPYEVRLNEQFVLTAMIMTCKTYGVPLPRDATKTLQLTKQGLAMTVSMKVDTSTPVQKAAG